MIAGYSLTDVRRRLQVDGKAKSSSGLLELPRSGHRQRHGRFGQGRGPRGAKCEIVQVTQKRILIEYILSKRRFEL